MQTVGRRCRVPTQCSATRIARRRVARWWWCAVWRLAVPMTKSWTAMWLKVHRLAACVGPRTARVHEAADGMPSAAVSSQRSCSAGTPGRRLRRCRGLVGAARRAERRSIWPATEDGGQPHTRLERLRRITTHPRRKPGGCVRGGVLSRARQPFTAQAQTRPTRLLGARRRPPRHYGRHSGAAAASEPDRFLASTRLDLPTTPRHGRLCDGDTPFPFPLQRARHQMGTSCVGGAAPRPRSPPQETPSPSPAPKSD